MRVERLTQAARANLFFWRRVRLFVVNYIVCDVINVEFLLLRWLSSCFHWRYRAHLFWSAEVWHLIFFVGLRRILAQVKSFASNFGLSLFDWDRLVGFFSLFLQLIVYLKRVVLAIRSLFKTLVGNLELISDG
jgi:hypothetical protein